MDYEKVRLDSKTKVHLFTGKDGRVNSRQREYKQQEHKRQRLARHAEETASVWY